MCINVKRAPPCACLPTALFPHGVMSRAKKALLSCSALDVALAITAMTLQTYAASNKKNLLCTKGLAGVLRNMPLCKQYTENVVLANLPPDTLPSVGCSLLHGLLCFGLNIIFTNALLSLQKYFIFSSTQQDPSHAEVHGWT